jgi:hypothetical protein
VHDKLCHCLHAQGVLDANWRELVPEKYRWHTNIYLDGLARAELVSLINMFLSLGMLRCLVHIVNLADLEEVVDCQSLRAAKRHQAPSLLWHELTLWSFSAI